MHFTWLEANEQGEQTAKKETVKKVADQMYRPLQANPTRTLSPAPSLPRTLPLTFTLALPLPFTLHRPLQALFDGACTYDGSKIVYASRTLAAADLSERARAAHWSVAAYP